MISTLAYTLVNNLQSREDRSPEENAIPGGGSGGAEDDVTGVRTRAAAALQSPSLQCVVCTILMLITRASGGLQSVMSHTLPDLSGRY